jgi:hypothetical protein
MRRIEYLLRLSVRVGLRSPPRLSTPARPPKKRMTCLVEIFSLFETSAGVKYSSSAERIDDEVDSVRPGITLCVAGVDVFGCRRLRIRAWARSSRLAFNQSRFPGWSDLSSNDQVQCTIGTLNNRRCQLWTRHFRVRRVVRVLTRLPGFPLAPLLGSRAVERAVGVAALWLWVSERVVRHVVILVNNSGAFVVEFREADLHQGFRNLKLVRLRGVFGQFAIQFCSIIKLSYWTGHCSLLFASSQHPGVSKCENATTVSRPHSLGSFVVMYFSFLELAAVDQESADFAQPRIAGYHEPASGVDICLRKFPFR